MSVSPAKNSDNISPTVQEKKQISPCWFFYLWFGFSVSFFLLIYVTRKDRSLSPIEAGLIPVLFLLTILIGRFVLPPSFLTSIRKKAVILISFLLSGLCVFYLFPGQIRPIFFIYDTIRINLNELDEDAKIILDWAYWAVEPDPALPEIVNYVHVADISFNQFEFSGGWERTEAGITAAKAENAALILHTSLFNNYVPVFHFRAESGGGKLSVTDGRETRDVAVQTAGDDGIFAIGTVSTAASRFFSKAVFLFALSAIFAGFAFSVRRFYAAGIVPKKIWIRAGSFLIPVMLLLSVCFSQQLYPFGQKTFFVADMEQMYSDMLAYLKTLTAENNDLFYSFSKNLGGDMLSPFAFYVANPINFAAALFQKQDLPKFVSWLIILKIGLAGFTGNLFLSRKQKESFSTLIFSTCYALMAYNAVNTENIHFLEGPILLPLVALGIERIIEQKRPFLYICSLFALLAVNFYQGYMVCIFAVLFFGFLLLAREEKFTFARFRAVGAQFLLSSILAAGGSAFLLLPTFVKLLNGTKSFSPSGLSFSVNFPFPDFFSKFFTGAHNEYEVVNGLPPVFSGILTTTLLILFFANREILFRRKIVTFCFFAILFLSFYLEPLNLLWHGLNEPVWWHYRNAFIFGFFAVAAAQYSFRKIGGIRPNSILICIFLFGTLSWFISQRNYAYLTNGGILADNLFNLLFCLFLYCYGKSSRSDTPAEQKSARSLWLFLTGLVCLLNLFLNTDETWQVNYGDSESIQEFAADVTQIDPVIQKIKHQDSGFYRIEKTFQRSYNDPLQFSYNGLSHYSSTTNPKILDLLRSLGLSQAHYWTSYAPGTTAAVDSLFGIKYLILPEGDPMPTGYIPLFSENGLTVAQNPEALSIGFAVPADIRNCKAVGDTPFDVQEQLLACLAAGAQGQLFPPAEATLAGQNLAPAMTDENLSPELVEWTIPITGSDALYAYMPQSERVFTRYDIDRNGTFYKSEKEMIDSGILPVGNFSTGDQVTIQAKELILPYSAENAVFRYENRSALSRYYEILSQEPVVLEKISSSHLRGTYTVQKENRALFFSIPYEKDWQIWIDGKKAEPFEVFGSLTAVETPPGAHTVEMKYIPIGLIPGMLISLISWAAVIVWRRKSAPISG